MVSESLFEIQQSLGCGINQRYLQQCLEKLSQKDQDKLYRVAQRFWFTTKLRYEASFWSSPYVPRQKELSVVFSEIPTLEIYLLCTCLDTLAGKTEYLEFDAWLEKQNISSGERLNITQVIQLFEKYKEEYGVSKNIKKLFINLPISVKSWLSEHVIIRPEKDQDRLTTLSLVSWLFSSTGSILKFGETHTHTAVSPEKLTLLKQWMSSRINPSGYSDHPHHLSTLQKIVNHGG